MRHSSLTARICLPILFAGVAARALVPAGYMPAAAGSGLLFELCHDGMPAAMMAALKGGGHAHHQHAAHAAEHRGSHYDSSWNHRGHGDSPHTGHHDSPGNHNGYGNGPHVGHHDSPGNHNGHGNGPHVGHHDSPGNHNGHGNGPHAGHHDSHGNHNGYGNGPHVGHHDSHGNHNDHGNSSHAGHHDGHGHCSIGHLLSMVFLDTDSTTDFPDRSIADFYATVSVDRLFVIRRYAQAPRGPPLA